MANEVLELGQSLFDVVIDAAARQQDEGDTDDSFPEDDVRATANEFFAALRVLLQMEEED